MDPCMVSIFSLKTMRKHWPRVGVGSTDSEILACLALAPWSHHHQATTSSSTDKSTFPSLLPSSVSKQATRWAPVVRCSALLSQQSTLSVAPPIATRKTASRHYHDPNLCVPVSLPAQENQTAGNSTGSHGRVFVHMCTLRPDLPSMCQRLHRLCHRRLRCPRRCHTCLAYPLPAPLPLVPLPSRGELGE